jgi:hypothetical protein
LTGQCNYEVDFLIAGILTQEELDNLLAFLLTQ